MEEYELHEVLRSTIAVPESTAYKHMINTIFSQSAPLPKKDFAYDSSLYKVQIFYYIYYIYYWIVHGAQTEHR